VKRLLPIATALVVLGCRPHPAAPFQAPDVVEHLLQGLPPGWTLVETAAGQIPRGHYVENGYYGGTLLVLGGPRDVQLAWLDEQGEWHHDPVLIESLELWVMPPAYRDSWRSLLDVHRPIPATLVSSGPRARVYGLPSHRVKVQDDFNRILQRAKATAAPEAHPSWVTWKTDLHDVLAKTP
jgi:hypothetical protein